MGVEDIDFSKMKRPELQKNCKNHKLKATGKNVELIARLEEYFQLSRGTKNEEGAGETGNKTEFDTGKIDSKNQQQDEETANHHKKEKTTTKTKREKPKKIKNSKEKAKTVKIEEPEINDFATQGITDEKHKAYVVAASDEELRTSNSSQDSLYCLPSVGADSVFMPGKLAEVCSHLENECKNNVETIILGSSVVNSTRLSSGDVTSPSSQLSPCTPCFHHWSPTFPPSPLEQRRLSSTQPFSQLDTSLDVIAYQSVGSDLQYHGNRNDETVGTAGWLTERKFFSENSTILYGDANATFEISKKNPPTANSTVLLVDDQDSMAANHKDCVEVSPDGQKYNKSACLDTEKTYLETDDTTVNTTANTTADTTVWLHDGKTEKIVRVASKILGKRVNSEDDVEDRRKTFILDNTRQINISEENKSNCEVDNDRKKYFSNVRVQGTDRRRTFQIAVPKLLHENQNWTRSEESEQTERKFSSETKEADLCSRCNALLRKENQPVISLQKDCHENEDTSKNEKKQNRRTFIAEKCGVMSNRRGTFVVSKVEDFYVDKDVMPNYEEDLNSNIKPTVSLPSSDQNKGKMSFRNHCVCHGNVSNSSEWKSLILKSGVANIQISNTEFEELRLKPSIRRVPSGYKDNLVCMKCVAENSKLLKKAGKENQIEKRGNQIKESQMKTHRTVSNLSKALGKQKSESCLLIRTTNPVKRKCEENHGECISSPATKKQMRVYTSGSPASPQVRKARGEKLTLPKRLLQPWKPRKASIDPAEKREDTAYAKRVEEILSSVQPGSEEEMELAMQKLPKIN